MQLAIVKSAAEMAARRIGQTNGIEVPAILKMQAAVIAPARKLTVKYPPPLPIFL